MKVEVRDWTSIEEVSACANKLHTIHGYKNPLQDKVRNFDFLWQF